MIYLAEVVMNSTCRRPASQDYRERRTKTSDWYLCRLMSILKNVFNASMHRQEAYA